MVKTWLFRRLFSSLGGIEFPAWWRLLQQNRWEVPIHYWPRGAFITALSIPNFLVGLLERPLDPPVDCPCAPPLFILGHWRSGTTLLQNMLAADRERFVTSTFISAMFPTTFRTSEWGLTPLLSLLLPQGRPVDGLAMGPQVPMEDEFAYCLTTGMSPYLGWSFPHRADHYERYLTFDNVSPAERDRWKQAVRRFVLKLASRARLRRQSPATGERHVVLKSPPHTARVRLLAELFPNARFLFVHRSPLDVFASTKQLLKEGLDGLRLQDPPRTRSLDDEILDRYRRLHDAYRRDRGLLAGGRLVEIRYSDLIADPVQTVVPALDKLGFATSSESQRALTAFAESTRGHRPNRRPELPATLQHRIAEEWQPYFEEWGYPLPAAVSSDGARS